MSTQVQPINPAAIDSKSIGATEAVARLAEFLPLARWVSDCAGHGINNFMRLQGQKLVEFITAAITPAAIDGAKGAAVDDAMRLDWLDRQSSAYGFEAQLLGYTWKVEGSFKTVREAIDAALTPQDTSQ